MWNKKAMFRGKTVAKLIFGEALLNRKINSYIILIIKDQVFGILPNSHKTPFILLYFVQNKRNHTHNSSSGSFLIAFWTMQWNAASTLVPSFAEVSKYGMFPFEAHQVLAFFSETLNQTPNKKNKKNTY